VVQFTLTPKFIAELRAICDYLWENRSEQVARELDDKVFEAIEKLEHSPQRWQRVEISDVDGEFRRILVGVYQIFYEYEIRENHITIYSIVDGRRRPPLFHPD